MAHNFDPNILGAETRFSELKVSLAYRVNSKTAKTSQRNLIWKKQKRNKQVVTSGKNVALFASRKIIEIKTYDVKN